VNLPTRFGKSMIFQGLPRVFSSLQPEREWKVVVGYHERLFESDHYFGSQVWG